MSRGDPLGGLSLVDLFRAEVGSQTAILSSGLLALEREYGGIEELLRAAHSIKGAARIVHVDPAVRIAHALEECFVSAQKSSITLESDDIDVLLRACDALTAIGQASEGDLLVWQESHRAETSAILDALAKVAALRPKQPEAPSPSPKSLFALFRAELASHTAAVEDLLAGLAGDPSPGERLEKLAREVHALRAAARIVNLEPVLRLAAALDNVVLAAQERRELVGPQLVTMILDATRELGKLAKVSDAAVEKYIDRESSNYEAIAARIGDSLRPVEEEDPAAQPQVAPAVEPSAGPAPEPERFVRVATGSINKLLGLSGEALVESRRLPRFTVSLDRLRHQQAQVVDALEKADEALRDAGERESPLGALIDEARARALEALHQVADQRAEIEAFSRRSEELSSRLYREAVATRMRPFSDGIQGFPRLVRDLARRLGKKCDLHIEGDRVRVDRDILDKMEAPINHMLRNAVDHGIESPALRRAAGKAERGTVRLEARHAAGALSLTISDDGTGIDTPKIRRLVAKRGLLEPHAAEALGEAEAMEYIFVSGFSTADEVTEVSGRGVGLDVVRSTVQEMGGSVRTHTEKGRGTSFHLQLPLTLSVTRAVVVEIAGEPHAFPLLRIDRLLKLPAERVRVMENRQFFTLDGRNIGLVPGRQVLELEGGARHSEELSVVVVSDRATQVGVVVDRFLGEQDLVVQPLDRRLGRVSDISAAAVTVDGRPLLIIDVEDMVRSIGRLLFSGRVTKVGGEAVLKRRGKKRVLVVDDSITVREVHRQILGARGYAVEVAVDGAAAWNTIRDSAFDLIVTDVDMPRMNGIELVRSVKQEPRLKSTPVMIVSYKERPEERTRGLEAGANYYLTKSDFRDEALLQAVVDLIGEPE